jgi:hypothetical protein
MGVASFGILNALPVKVTTVPQAQRDFVFRERLIPFVKTLEIPERLTKLTTK